MERCLGIMASISRVLTFMTVSCGSLSIIRWPKGGVVAGRKIDGLIELVDLLPTFLMPRI